LTEHFRWWGAIPLQRRFIMVVYEDQQGTRYNRYEISNRNIYGQDEDEEAIKAEETVSNPVPGGAPTPPLTAPMPPGPPPIPGGGKSGEEGSEPTPDKEDPAPNSDDAPPETPPKDDGNKDDGNSEKQNGA
jgi:hypothetical protein